MAIEALSADAVQGWIPVSEKLPKINQLVIISLTDGEVRTGYRSKPDIVWQVTEYDGRKHWVYDPESYTDDIDSLPKAEDCYFYIYPKCDECAASVTSINYDGKFAGVTAWMPLPEPYKGGDSDE